MGLDKTTLREFSLDYSVSESLTVEMGSPINLYMTDVRPCGRESTIPQMRIFSNWQKPPAFDASLGLQV